MCEAIDPRLISKVFILKIFNLDSGDINFESISSHNYLKPGNDIKKIDILFKKIEKKND